ncbi:MAG: ion transporter [Thermodesulfobacteriota bacterium]|nr:ion transporter [Thermodesulfobacteriota bacterium]
MQSKQTPAPSAQYTHRSPFRERLNRIIFETDTPAGKLFDVVLIASICISVISVILDSVPSFHTNYGRLLYATEWVFTILFSLEYGLRLFSAHRPARYAFSFFGLVDLLSIVPTYLSVFIPGSQTLLTIRTFRLLRVFRVFKLTYYTREAGVLIRALRASIRKISVFLTAVLAIVVIAGSVMYVVEGADSGFTDIPTSMYWAIVTLTTVGYGDISPVTPLGKGLASFLMIVGYGIIAVPTGIVTVEIAQSTKKTTTHTPCPHCGLTGHAPDATYCRGCGKNLV